MIRWAISGVFAKSRFLVVVRYGTAIIFVTMALAAALVLRHDNLPHPFISFWLAAIATTITFSQPLQIPGQVLPAGTYLFELADRGAEPNVVQIFNSDRTVLYGTFLTIATERQEATDDTSVTLAEPESGGTPVLVKWLYPGRDTGNEFVYAKQTEKEIARGSQHTIAAGQTATSNSDSTGAGN
jgi:hypothetical protein